MARTLYVRSFSGLLLVVAGVIGNSATLQAESPAKLDRAKSSSASAPISGLFDATRAGDLGVQFIPRDAREATLILTNNTDQPLSIRLPDAFAAVPILAQQQPLFGAGPALNQPGNNTTGKSKQTQPLSTSGQPRAAQGQQQPRGGVMSIPAERVMKLKYPVVCLAYSKPEPNAHIPYEIVPIDTFTNDVALQTLCRQFGDSKVAQPVAQAAAWHLANQMSWEKLSALKHWPHNRGFSSPVFTSDQIHAAMALVDKATKAADGHTASVATSREK